MTSGKCKKAMEDVLTVVNGVGSVINSPVREKGEEGIINYTKVIESACHPSHPTPYTTQSIHIFNSFVQLDPNGG